MLGPNGILILGPNPKNKVPPSFGKKAKSRANQMFTYLSYLVDLEQWLLIQ